LVGPWSGRAADRLPRFTPLHRSFDGVLNHKGYERKDGRSRRSELVDELLSEATWLSLDGHEEPCRASDDALDAVFAAMTARAAGVGLTESIPPEALLAAETEGWIALPRVDTLAELATSV
jgi:hypothetical protein